MWNNSKSPIKYTWENITDCTIMEVEPLTGVIGKVSATYKYQLMIEILKLVQVDERSYRTLYCKVSDRADPQPAGTSRRLHLVPRASVPALWQLISAQEGETLILYIFLF